MLGNTHRIHSYFHKIILAGASLAVTTASTSFALDSAYFNQLRTERVESDKKLIWEQVGPGNAGFANIMRYHPTQPDTIYMCPDMWNSYQSDDNGTSWYNIKDPDGDGDFYHIRDMYYSHSEPTFGLALESSQLWKTNDTGKNWAMIKNCPWYDIDSDGSDSKAWISKTSTVAIDPLNEDIWYVGEGRHLRGQEWLSCLRDATAATPRGYDNDYSGKIWKTTNAGTSWTELSTGIDASAQFCRIIVNPSNTQQVFAASQYGIYRSNDGGSNWTNVGEGEVADGKLPNNTIMDMDYYYDSETNSFVLYLIDQVRYFPDADNHTTINTGGIYKSTDNGDTWGCVNGDLYLDVNRLTGSVPEYYYRYIAMWFGISTTEAESL